MTLKNFRSEIKRKAAINQLQADVVDFGENVHGEGTKLCRVVAVSLYDSDDEVVFCAKTGKISTVEELTTELEWLTTRLEGVINSFVK